MIANDPHELQVANRATAHLYIVNPFRQRKLAEPSGCRLPFRL